MWLSIWYYVWESLAEKKAPAGEDVSQVVGDDNE